MFSDPWAYSISNFPNNYKLFAVDYQREGDTPPRRDYYLCGMLPFLSFFGVQPDPLPLSIGGKKDYRSPVEFYPHLHWLLNSAQGINNPCICKCCGTKTKHKVIKKTFPLPPCKGRPTKESRGPKKSRQTRKLKKPRGFTGLKVITKNRNSYTTGPMITQGQGGQKVIGHTTSHPFR
jgi:hypothetical protein